MPDTGAPWNIPYVAGTDLVSDWPTDSQSLANAIVSGLDIAGTIRQVVQTVKNDTFTTSSITFTPLTGLSVTITPTDSSHKVLVLWDIVLGAASGSTGLFNLMRGATAIKQSTGASTNATVSIQVPSNESLAQVAGSFLDSPATTSATTYSFDCRKDGGDIYINRRGLSHAQGATSSITVIEVAA